jgi:hypothetical protein
MTFGRPDFVSALQDFAAGITPVTSFHEWVRSILVTEGPLVTRNNQDELAAIFPFEADCAIYLDMVTGSGDPNLLHPDRVAAGSERTTARRQGAAC